MTSPIKWETYRCDDFHYQHVLNIWQALNNGKLGYYQFTYKCGYQSCRLSLCHPNEPYHPQVVHEAGAMLPDLGGLARELSGANILAPVQLLNRCHHSVHCIKEESGGELQRRTEGG